LSRANRRLVVEVSFQLGLERLYEQIRAQNHDNEQNDCQEASVVKHLVQSAVVLRTMFMELMTYMHNVPPCFCFSDGDGGSDIHRVFRRPPAFLTRAGERDNRDGMRLTALAVFVFAAALAKADKPGWQSVVFKELPSPATTCKFKHKFIAADESFELYVPKTKADGILVWINPTEEAKIPRQFEPLFDEFRLLAVTAARCGNKAEPGRREALAMVAALQLSKQFPVDPKRRIVSGLSGGGRFSALACFVHPEFWRGAISWCGGFFYDKYDALEKGPGWHRNGINHYFPGLVTPELAAAARANCRFALITGAKDVNLDDCRDIDAALAKEKFQHLLIEEPGLGHAVGSNENMRRALEFVLGSSNSRPCSWPN